ncbi:hypothetical protein BDV12DRAFT_91872 [Aspergillus spectabilis]
MEDESNCDIRLLLSYSNKTIAGIYLGPSFGRDTASFVLKRLVEHIQAKGVAETTLVQLCGDGRNANHVLGVAVSTAGNIAVVQELLSSWSRAECPSDFDQMVTWDEVAGSAHSDTEKRALYHHHRATDHDHRHHHLNNNL